VNQPINKPTFQYDSKSSNTHEIILTILYTRKAQKTAFLGIVINKIWGIMLPVNTTGRPNYTRKWWWQNPQKENERAL